jgi:hypothetical protein
MWLLAIGVAVGALAVLLIRTLNQFENTGLASVHDHLLDVETRLADAESRIEALEVIASADSAAMQSGIQSHDGMQADLPDPDSATDSRSRERRRS